MNTINNLLAETNFFGSAFFILAVVAVVVLALLLVMLEVYYKKRAKAAEGANNANAQETETAPEEQVKESVAAAESEAQPEEQPEAQPEETPAEEPEAQPEEEEPEEEAEQEPEEEEPEAEVEGAVAVAAVPVAVADAGTDIRITQRKSFQAKLILNRDLIPIYEELKDLALSYKKVKSQISFKCEKFSCGRKILMRFFVKGKRLYIYYATTVEGFPEKYRLVDVSDKGIGKQLPALQKVLSTRSVKYAKEMIEKLMEQNEIPALPPEKVKKTDYSELLKKRTVSEMVEEGLIKEV